MMSSLENHNHSSSNCPDTSSETQWTILICADATAAVPEKHAEPYHSVAGALNSAQFKHNHVVLLPDDSVMPT